MTIETIKEIIDRHFSEIDKTKLFPSLRKPRVAVDDVVMIHIEEYNSLVDEFNRRGKALDKICRALALEACPECGEIGIHSEGCTEPGLYQRKGNEAV